MSDDLSELTSSMEDDLMASMDVDDDENELDDDVEENGSDDGSDLDDALEDQGSDLDDDIEDDDETDDMDSAEATDFSDDNADIDVSTDTSTFANIDIEDAVYRLYEAAFNRPADSDGLFFWTSQVNVGQSLSNISDTFVSSGEFIAQYGESVDDQTFVKLLYDNVLDRQADEDGLSYWTGLLDDGFLDRGDVLLEFSRSVENIGLSLNQPETDVIV